MSDRKINKAMQIPNGNVGRAIDLSHVRRRVRSGREVTRPGADRAPDVDVTATSNAANAQTSCERVAAVPTKVIKTKHGRKEVTYETGYGLPPKSGQFKSGQSGNKKGRPKGSINLRTAMEALYLRPMEIRRNGKMVKMPFFQVILEQDAMKAASGEAKAIARVRSDVLKLMGLEEAKIAKARDVGLEEEAAITADLTDSERRMLRHIKKIDYAKLGFAEEDIEDLLDIDFGPDKPAAVTGTLDASNGVTNRAETIGADLPEDEIDTVEDDGII